MKVKSVVLRGLVGCFVIFAMSAVSSGAVAHIEAFPGNIPAFSTSVEPEENTDGTINAAILVGNMITIPLNEPGTGPTEAIFNVVLDSATTPVCDLFDIIVALDPAEPGARGIVFNVAEMNARGANNLIQFMGPNYIFPFDSFSMSGSTAGPATWLVNVGDIASANTPLGNGGQLMARLIITIPDDPIARAAALEGNGMHLLAGYMPPTGGVGSALEWEIDPNTAGVESLNVAPLAFQVTPEPATMTLLVLGGISVMVRRKRR